MQGHWRLKADAKGNDAPSPSGVVVDKEKVKSSMFLLIGISNGIRPVNCCTKILLLNYQKRQFRFSWKNGH